MVLIVIGIGAACAGRHVDVQVPGRGRGAVARRIVVYIV